MGRRRVTVQADGVKSCLARAAVLLVVLALSGCIGEGNEPIVGPPQQSSSTISGSVFKGAFTSGTARVREISATGVLGAELGTADVGADATFQVSVGSHTGPVCIEVSGGSFDDELAGATTQTAPIAAVLASAAASPTVVVTPLTHMAAAVALRDISANSTPVADAVNAANALIAGYYKISAMLTTQPAILSEGAASAGNAANYGALLAAISQQADGLGIASDVLAAALGLDAAEGTLDGQDGGGPVPAGAGNLPADAGRAGLGTALSAFLASGANTSTLTAADFTALLARLSAVPPAMLFIESIAVTPADKTIGQAMQVNYAAIATMSDGTTPDITATAAWLSSDAGIAQITGTSSAVAGPGTGPATISAMAGGVTGQTTLTVGAFTLSSIAVTPAAPTLAPGRTQAFTATATYSDASTGNISDIVQWQSSDTNLLTIDALGVATTIAVGNPTVTATELGTALFSTAAVTITVRYNTDIQPLFFTNCVTCHSGSGAPFGLRLTNYSFLMAGSTNGPVVIPGDPDNSEIIKRLEGTKLPRMPNEAPPLPQSTINLVRTWIALGAQNN